MSSSTSVPKKRKNDSELVPSASASTMTSDTSDSVSIETSSLSPALVLEAFDTLPRSAFRTLLGSTLLPLIPNLPLSHVSSIEDSLKAAFETQKLKKDCLIGFSKREKVLADGLKALLRHCRTSWHDGYETQAVMMCQLVDEMTRYLQDLFPLLDLSEDLSTVNKACLLIQNTFDEIAGAHSRAEFNQMFFDLKITRKKANTDEDEVVYQASRFEDIIAKSWRDVALSALVAGGKENEAIVAEIVKRVEKSNPQSKQRFMSFLRTAGSISLVNAAGYSFDDHWHSPQMKAALPRLKDAFLSTQIALFKSKPSSTLYATLIAKDASLKPTLLTAVESQLVDDRMQKATVILAIELYSQSTDSVLALLSLIDRLSRLYLPWVQSTLSIAVLGLAKLSPEGRTLAQPLFLKFLQAAESEVWSEMRDALPGLDSALDNLEGEFQERGYPIDGPSSFLDAQTEISQARERAISNCIRAAAGEEGHDYNPNEGPLNPNDSDYEEELERRKPDLAGAIRAWMSVLWKWPDEIEKLEMMKEHTESCTGPFYEIDGLGNQLACRLSSQWNNDDSKQHISDGIKALYASASIKTERFAAGWRDERW